MKGFKSVYHLWRIQNNYEQYLIDLKAYNEGELEEQPVEPELYNTYLIHSELVDITPYIQLI